MIDKRKSLHAIILFLSLIVFINIVNAQDKVAVYDGPYVFWHGDKLIVEFICDSQIVTKIFKNGSSFNIWKSCCDTTKTFTINKKTLLPESDVYTNVSKIFAISDLHGHFDKMLALLKGNGIIDEKNKWIWGNGHLVIDGDIFDRGDKVTETLWFVYELEKQAKQAGGDVHYLLGNHEIMVLRGDLRNVNKKYMETTAKLLKIKVEDLFGPESELGRWLRTKNVITKLNDILFVHGGISYNLIEKGFDINKVNELIRANIDARDYQIKYDDELNFLFGSKGPIWYRGLIEESNGIPIATKDEVNSTLNYFNAKGIVVGHTIIDSLSGFYDNRVFDIETGIIEGKEGEALLVIDGVFYRTDPKGYKIKLK